MPWALLGPLGHLSLACRRAALRSVGRRASRSGRAHIDLSVSRQPKKVFFNFFDRERHFLSQLYGFSVVTALFTFLRRMIVPMP